MIPPAWFQRSHDGEGNPQLPMASLWGAVTARVVPPLKLDRSVRGWKLPFACQSSSDVTAVALLRGVQAIFEAILSIKQHGRGREGRSKSVAIIPQLPVMAESYFSSVTSQRQPMVNPKNNSDTFSKENKTLAVSDDLLWKKRFINDECQYESWSSLMTMKAAPTLWWFYCMRGKKNHIF